MAKDGVKRQKPLGGKEDKAQKRIHQGPPPEQKSTRHTRSGQQWHLLVRLNCRHQEARGAKAAGLWRGTAPAPTSATYTGHVSKDPNQQLLHSSRNDQQTNGAASLVGPHR